MNLPFRKKVLVVGEQMRSRS